MRGLFGFPAGGLTAGSLLFGPGLGVKHARHQQSEQDQGCRQRQQGVHGGGFGGFRGFAGVRE